MDFLSRMRTSERKDNTRTIQAFTESGNLDASFDAQKQTVSRPQFNPGPVEDDEYSDYTDDLSEEEDCEQEDEFDIIDRLNSSNILNVSKSASSIFRKAKEEEVNIPISKEMILQTQTEILPKHREIAMRWLILINYRFKYSSETLYNAVTTLDITLSHKNIKQSELQLYAMVCYWIAAKIDVRCHPTVEEFNAVSDENFTTEQFFKTEIEVLMACNFELSYPTSKFYMRRYLQATEKSPDVIEVTNFFTEIALQKWDFVGVRPSTVALAATFLASASLGFDLDAFRVIRAAHCDEPDTLLEVAKAMLSYGKQTKIRQEGNGQGIELFSKLNFDFNPNRYIF